MPLSIAVSIGIPCSTILPLTALFVETAEWTGTRLPDAPDANPPLSFILLTVTLLGGLTVPAMLILLGASFARLKVSIDCIHTVGRSHSAQITRKWRDLPICAIVVSEV